jgi:hypothetical protein
MPTSDVAGLAGRHAREVPDRVASRRPGRVRDLVQRGVQPPPRTSGPWRCRRSCLRRRPRPSPSPPVALRAPRRPCIRSLISAAQSRRVLPGRTSASSRPATPRWKTRERVLVVQNRRRETGLRKKRARSRITPIASAGRGLVLVLHRHRTNYSPKCFVKHRADCGRAPGGPKASSNLRSNTSADRAGALGETRPATRGPPRLLQLRLHELERWRPSAPGFRTRAPDLPSASAPPAAGVVHPHSTRARTSRRDRPVLVDRQPR